MVILYCPDKRPLDQLAAAIPAEYDTMAVSDPAGCLGELVSATCFVVALRNGADVDASAWLRRRPARALVPLVLVVPEEADTVRRMTAAAPAAVVWWHAVHRELGRAIERAIGSVSLGRVATAIETSPGIPAVLRSALAAACRTTPPIVSVGALSKAVDRSERWLQRCWRNVVPDPAHRLEDFLAWVLLVRAYLIAAEGASREEVATLVGRTVRTLDRIAGRLEGTTFHALRSRPAQEITRAFRRSALAPIAGGAILRELTG